MVIFRVSRAKRKNLVPSTIAGTEVEDPGGRGRCNTSSTDRFVSRVFFTNVFAPHESPRGAGQGAEAGRVPWGCCSLRKDRLNYASKRSGSKVFSRSTEQAVAGCFPRRPGATMSPLAGELAT